MSWVRVQPEAAYFSLKVTVLGELYCVVLYCFDQDIHMYMYVHVDIRDVIIHFMYISCTVNV